jgi:hypothetical protein
MKRTTLAIVLLLTSNMSGQKGDWAAVEELPAGTPISVLYGKFPIHDRCTFENATNDKLICERNPQLSSRIFIPIPLPNEAMYSRKHIRAVRLEYSDAHNIFVGMAIGAGAGAAIGAAGSGDPKARGGAAVLFGLGGGVLGGFLGKNFPIFHRKTIYRQ